MAKIYEFGTAPQAKAEGYALKKLVQGTRESVLKGTEDKDIIFVQGPEFFDKPGFFEFAMYTPGKPKDTALFETESKRLAALGWKAHGIRLMFNNGIVDKVNSGLMTLSEGKRHYRAIESHPCLEKKTPGSPGAATAPGSSQIRDVSAVLLNDLVNTSPPCPALSM